MFIEVIKAEYVDGYRIKLWFNNSVTKVVDLKSSLKGMVFEPLKDLNFFKRFSVKYNTVEWENGADFAPEYLLALPKHSPTSTLIGRYYFAYHVVAF